MEGNIEFSNLFINIQREETTRGIVLSNARSKDEYDGDMIEILLTGLVIHSSSKNSVLKSTLPGAVTILGIVIWCDNVAASLGDLYESGYAIGREFWGISYMHAGGKDLRSVLMM